MAGSKGPQPAHAAGVNASPAASRGRYGDAAESQLNRELMPAGCQPAWLRILRRLLGSATYADLLLARGLGSHFAQSRTSSSSSHPLNPWVVAGLRRARIRTFPSYGDPLGAIGGQQNNRCDAVNLRTGAYLNGDLQQPPRAIFDTAARTLTMDLGTLADLARETAGHHDQYENTNPRYGWCDRCART